MLVGRGFNVFDGNFHLVSDIVVHAFGEELVGEAIEVSSDFDGAKHVRAKRDISSKRPILKSGYASSICLIVSSIHSSLFLNYRVLST